jgi:hypothetical protein
LTGRERGHAGWLYDLLARHFGDERVFRDVASMEPGLDFNEQIDAALKGCRVLLVIIGPSWLDASDLGGGRRLDDEDDVVRLEVARALGKEGMRVIRFSDDVDDLIKHLEPIVEDEPPAAPPSDDLSSLPPPVLPPPPADDLSRLPPPVAPPSGTDDLSRLPPPGSPGPSRDSGRVVELALIGPDWRESLSRSGRKEVSGVQVYPCPPAVVAEAVPVVLTEDAGLMLVPSDRARGVFEASTGMRVSMGPSSSWGERVAVTVTAVGDNATRVEVSSRFVVGVQVTGKKHHEENLAVVFDNLTRRLSTLAAAR